MADIAEHAVFVLPTREDIAIFEGGGKPGNVLWREFATEAELQAYADGIEHIEDEFDDIDEVVRDGLRVTVRRGGGADRFEFASVAAVEAFVQGIEDAVGFHAPRLIGREDEGFARLADLGHADVTAPRP